MDFEQLLEYKSPESLEEGAIYWEFKLFYIKTPNIRRQGDTGHYAPDENECNKTFVFHDFGKFREAYISAHEENIRRLKEGIAPLLEIGPMYSNNWPPWGKDSCG